MQSAQPWLSRKSWGHLGFNLDMGPRHIPDSFCCCAEQVQRRCQSGVRHDWVRVECYRKLHVVCRSCWGVACVAQHLCRAFCERITKKFLGGLCLQSAAAGKVSPEMRFCCLCESGPPLKESIVTRLKRPEYRDWMASQHALRRAILTGYMSIPSVIEMIANIVFVSGLWQCPVGKKQEKKDSDSLMV